MKIYGLVGQTEKGIWPEAQVILMLTSKFVELISPAQ